MHKWILSLVILLTCLTPIPAAAQTQNTYRAEILWDSWGVPHIYAEDNASLFYAFGWASAHNHADVILQLYAEARGRAAEYWGADYAASDTLIRTLGVPLQAEREYAALDDEWRGYVDAFAEGMNAYAAANPDAIAQDKQIVLPVGAVDVMAHGIRSLRWTFVAGRGVRYAARQDATLAQAFAHVPSDELMASNAWAVNAPLSASGNAMLVINPHQPWFGLGQWFEAHFVTPDMNLYGAALIGNPVLGVGFNEHLGWAHTVNTQDGWDLYELTLTDDGYLLDGESVPFTLREDFVTTLEADGSTTQTPFTVRESVFGVVLAEHEPGKALAIRAVAEDVFAAAQQWWAMGQTTDFDAFEAALRDVHIPMFTVMYADSAGNIMHLSNAQVPIRDSGDWEFWNNTNILGGTPSLIPGDTTQYLWEHNYHPYEDLFRVVNPASGWLQNANEPPHTTTFPYPHPVTDFPAYMYPEPYVWPRPIQSMRLMAEAESVTFEDLIDLKQTTYIELSRMVLDDLIAAAYASEDETAVQAADVLSAWDRHADADSAGGVLFVAWANQHVTDFNDLARAWDAENPLNSLGGLADPEAAVADLIEIAAGLERLRALGAGMDVAYGDVFRLRYLDSGLDLPASGAEDLLGTFRTLTFVQDRDLRFRPVAGDSFVAVIEFGDTLQAQVLLAHGNATQPGSPHVGDQLVLFAEKALRVPHLTRESAEADAVRVDVFD